MTDATSILSGGVTFSDNTSSFTVVQRVQAARLKDGSTSVFPIRFKNKSGKTPSGIVVLSAVDAATKKPISLTGHPAWHVEKDNLVIADLPGLDKTKTTDVTFLVVGG